VDLELEAMLRGLRSAVLAVLLLLPATLARAHGSVPNGFQVRSSAAIHEGVEHLTLTAADPAQSVQVARVGPGAPVALKAVSAYDAIPHRTAQHELPSDMCRRVGCIAGINGDFHDPDPDQPRGGVVTGGRLLRSPRAGYGQLTLAADGTLHAGPLGWSGSLTAGGGPAVALTGVNVDRGANDVVLYTPVWGGSTPSGAEIELVVQAAGPVGTIGASTVTVVGSRATSGGIPADGAVLSGVGPAAKALRDLAARVASGAPAQLQLSTSVNAVESLGVHPVLLRDGQRVYPDVADGFTRFRAPRTLFGWNRAGERFLVTVDGRRDDAGGMSLAQAADLLQGLGATDAVNFDGGGGTTFVVAGEVKNLPSDPRNPGPPAYPNGHVIAPGHVERMAPNALVLVPKPRDPEPGPDPSGTTTTTTSPGAGPGSGSGSDGPAGGDIPFTNGGRLFPEGPGGGLAGSPDDPAFIPGGDGSFPRLEAAPDKKSGRNKKGKGKGDGRDGTPGDASGDWLSGVAPSFPGFGSGPGPAALAFGGDDESGPPLGVAISLAGMLAGGMILLVLSGINRVRQNRRTRPPLWL
jgi:hypothetical protein